MKEDLSLASSGDEALRPSLLASTLSSSSLSWSRRTGGEDLGSKLLPSRAPDPLFVSPRDFDSLLGLAILLLPSHPMSHRLFRSCCSQDTSIARPSTLPSPVPPPSPSTHPQPIPPSPAVSLHSLHAPPPLTSSFNLLLFLLHSHIYFLPSSPPLLSPSLTIFLFFDLPPPLYPLLRLHILKNSSELSAGRLKYNLQEDGRVIKEDGQGGREGQI